MSQPPLKRKRELAQKFRDEVITILGTCRDWANCCPLYLAHLDQADAELETGDPQKSFEYVIRATEEVLDLLVSELSHPDLMVAVDAAETLLKLRRAVLKME